VLGEQSRDTVREACGFGSEDAMQDAFRRRLGLIYGDPAIEADSDAVIRRLAAEASVPANP
jgi:hypothetical protein